jgi:hypothetical protein
MIPLALEQRVGSLTAGAAQDGRRSALFRRRPVLI